MCGICGVIARDHAQLDDVAEAQVATMHHRGPDSHGTFRTPYGAISQNRLSIIDLVHGDPPITNEDGTSAVVLNGEIYNFKELRSGLLERGHRLSSEGDTETIVHLSEELSPVELARALDGMFAFAVWDGRRERLIVGRDRLGKKPLYYAFDGERLVFGSEIKSIFADTSVPRRLDPEAIPAYLTFGYVPTPRTFFAGVRSLPPGHVLVFEPGGEPHIERYWEPPLADVNAGPHFDLSLDEAAKRVRETLTRAVDRRLIADVPLGAFLSGGIDSSAIVGVMASLIERPVETFTIGFDDRDGFDERPFARAVAERHRTAHHEYVVHPNAVDLVERLVWHHDQPFGDSSAVPTFLLSEVTRGEVTVALSGDGGDELFAGYERFGAGLLAQRFRSLPGPLRRAARGSVELLPAGALRGRAASAQRFARVAELGLPDAYRSWISYIQDPERVALTGGAADDWAIEDYRSIWRGSAGADTLDRLLNLNLRTYLLDDLLVKADRMSMAHSLEVRSPFLDTELLQLASQLEPRLKLRGIRLKRVLKAAVSDLMPEELLNRPKRGFGVPLDRWFREDLRSYMEATLGAPDSRVKAHLDAAAVDHILAEHDSRARNHGHALWTLLTLEVFLRREGW
ncbi:MAG TPA: asparagine synthase (glutamine-hydrolyzing) [Solirubrobacteraceae bacterium]|nr:asparagine synthase (glutamine-hydrolyzing) [Solirubrobacteraceae bacterium]